MVFTARTSHYILTVQSSATKTPIGPRHTRGSKSLHQQHYKCAPAAGLVLRHFEVSLHCDAFQPAHNMLPLPQRADALKYTARSSNSGETLSTVVFPCSTFFTFGKTGTGSGAFVTGSLDGNAAIAMAGRFLTLGLAIALAMPPAESILNMERLLDGGKLRCDRD